ncbi:MAG: TetR family transcriptional regulator C-terminal domain-containing protein [Amaricoccus sp.]
MNEVRPTQRERRQRVRETIRAAAIEEFAANGLAGTSTQAIADRAGLSKAQLHYYIDSKDELYEEVLRDIVADWRSIFLVSAAAAGPAAAISGYIRAKIGHALENPHVVRLFSREVAAGAPVLGRHWAPLREAMEIAAGVLRGWIDEGRMAPVDPYMLQMHIWAVTQFYADQQAHVRALLDLGDRPIDEARVADEVVALFLTRCGLQLPEEETRG